MEFRDFEILNCTGYEVVLKLSKGPVKLPPSDYVARVVASTHPCKKAKVNGKEVSVEKVVKYVVKGLPNLRKGRRALVRPEVYAWICRFSPELIRMGKILTYVGYEVDDKGRIVVDILLA